MIDSLTKENGKFQIDLSITLSDLIETLREKQEELHLKYPQYYDFSVCLGNVDNFNNVINVSFTGYLK
jgi:hypothetical protein